MAQKQHEMKYVISANAKGLTVAFKDTQAALSETQQKIIALSNTAKDISAYEKQQKAVESTRQQLELLESQYNNYQREMDETGQFSAKLANQQDKVFQKLENTDAELRQQEQTLQQLGQALQEAGFDTDDLARESKELNDQIAKLAQEELDAAKAEQEMAEGADKASDEMKDVADSAKEAGESSESFGDKAATAITGVSSLLVSAGIAQMVREIYDALMECASASGDFQAAMSNVEALSGATSDEMAQLTATAKELGATTQFTAEQSAEAMGYMAMAGWDANQMLSGIGATMSLAAASGEDLATVSDIVTDALTAFGLQASDAAHFADVLAATATGSNTSVSIMGETFKKAAPVAGALGYSIEDVSVAIGLMANAGVKGSRAGTVLSNTFTGLLGGVTLTSEAFGEAEVSALQADGTMASFADTIKMLRGYFDQMTEAEKTNNAMAIAGKYGYAGLLSILNATDADFVKLTDSINDCTGAAEQMAAIKLDNLNGQLTLMESAWDGVKIAIGDSLSPVLEYVYGLLADVFGEISEFVNEHPAIVAAIGTFAGAIGAATVAVTGIAGAMALASAAGVTLSAALPVVGVVVGVSAAIAALAGVVYELANSGETASEAMHRLSGEVVSLDENEALLQQYQLLSGELDDSALSAEELAEKQLELDAVTQQLKDTYPELLGQIEAGTKAWELQLAAIQANIDAEQAAAKAELEPQVEDGIKELHRLKQEYENAQQALEDLQDQMAEALDYDTDGAVASLQAMRDELGEGLELGTIEFDDEAFQAKLNTIRTTIETLLGTDVELDGLADVDYYIEKIADDGITSATVAARWAETLATAQQSVADAYSAYSTNQGDFADMLRAGTVTMDDLREMAGDTGISMWDFGVTAQDVAMMVVSGTMSATEAARRYSINQDVVERAVSSLRSAQVGQTEAVENLAEATDEAEEANERSYLQMLRLQYASELVRGGYTDADQAANAYGLEVDDLNDYLDELEDHDNRVVGALGAVESGFMSAETAARNYGVTVDEIQTAAIEEMKAAIDDVAEAYNAAYDAAYKSLSGQFALWDKADEVTATSLTDLQAALDSQQAYWDSYNANLAVLQSYGLDTTGIWDHITDGSSDAAAAAQGLVDALNNGDTAAVDAYVQAYENLQTTIGDTSAVIASTSDEVQAAFDAAAQVVEQGVAAFDLESEAYTAAGNTLLGYARGLDEGNNFADWYSTQASAWLAAFHASLGEHSPSTITQEAGLNTMLGFQQGVEDGAPDSEAAMIAAADTFIAAFEAVMNTTALYDAGRDAMRGAINGITSMLPELREAARQAGEQAANAYKDSQQIQSPSKLFAYFSEMDIQGAIKGLEQHQQEANAAFANAAEQGAEAYQQTAITLPAPVMPDTDEADTTAQSATLPSRIDLAASDLQMPNIPAPQIPDIPEPVLDIDISQLKAAIEDMDMQGALKSLQGNQKEAQVILPAIPMETQQPAEQSAIPAPLSRERGAATADEFARVLSAVSASQPQQAAPVEAVSTGQAQSIVISVAPVYNFEGVEHQEELRAELDLHSNDMKEFIRDVVRENLVDAKRGQYL